MQKGKVTENKGITIIALIITIIVMLILVAVTVTVALNVGLFTTAKEAAEGTEHEKGKEEKLSNGEVEIDGLVYASLEDYANGNPKLADGFEIATDEERANAWKKETVKNENVTAIKETATNKIIPLPKGFQVSLEEGENSTSEGVVIKDGANEFVWIPVLNAETYTEDSFGPLTSEITINGSKYAYDSQEILNYYYGTKEDGTPYFNYSDFNYAEDKTNIERSIRTYGGFYVGRYETTIDESGTIGCKANTKVLRAGTIIKDGTNPNISTSSNKYYYRWYGLYKVQKDIYANNPSVGSLMISSKQRDAIMTYTGYGDTKRPTNTYTTKPDLSGSAYKDANPAQYDVSKNIYDLAGNVCEWTLKASSTNRRVLRGRSLCHQQRFGL